MDDYDILVWLLCYLMDTHKIETIEVKREWYEEFVRSKRVFHVHTRISADLLECKRASGFICTDDPQFMSAYQKEMLN